MTSNKIGQLFAEPQDQPLSMTATAAGIYPSAQRYFYVAGSGYTTQQTVYQDALLQTPFAQPIVANANGVFAPIYMDPALQYESRLYSSVATGSALLRSATPVGVSSLAVRYTAFKANPTVRSSTAVLAIDPDLQIAIPGAGTYKFEFDCCMIAAVAGTTPGISLSVNYSGTLNASAANNYSIVGEANATTTSVGALAIGAAINFSVAATQGNGNNCVRLQGTFQATTAGTLSLYWCQNISSANSTTLQAGCSLVVTRLFATAGGNQQTGIPFTDPQTRPRAPSGLAYVSQGQVQAGAYRLFLLAGSATPEPVYWDAALKWPMQQPVYADGAGRFPPIYLNPAISYRAQLYSSGGTLLSDVSPVNNSNPSSTSSVTNALYSVVKQGITAVGSSATPAPDPVLQVYLPQAGTYKVDIDGYVQQPGQVGAGAGVLMSVRYPANSLNFNAGNCLVIYGVQAGVGITGVQNAFAIDGAINLAASGQVTEFRMTGTIQVTTPGTLQLYWSQAANSATACSLGPAALTAYQIG